MCRQWLAVAVALMCVAIPSSLTAQGSGGMSLRIARLSFMESVNSLHYTDQRVRIPVTQQSISSLSAPSLRVRAIRRAFLVNLRAEADGCVTIPAYSYQVYVSSAGLEFGVDHTWLRRGSDGAALDSPYLLVFEVGYANAEFIRVKKRDLDQYLNAGFPIVIAPPGSYSRSQLVALGLRIGVSAVPVIVSACMSVSSRDTVLELAAAPCGNPAVALPEPPELGYTGE